MEDLVMKNMIQKIVLMAVMFSLSVLVYAAMENNSILRFQSTNKDGKVVYAVAQADGSVVAMTADDTNFVLENSLWLAHGNDNNFNIQNLGTTKYLNQDSETGTRGERHYLITSDNSLSLRRDNIGYYWAKSDGFWGIGKNYLYIQYGNESCHHHQQDS